MAKYTYTISTQTLNGAVNAYKLFLECAGAGLPVSDVTTILTSDQVVISTTATLDAGQVTTLDAVVAAHDGAAVPVPINHASVLIEPKEISITNASFPASPDGNPAGQLGMVTSKPEFFGDIANFIGQVLGTVNVIEGASGEQPQIRILERNTATGVENVVLGPVSLAATSGFALLNVVSPVPGALGTSYNEYIVQACLNGANQLFVRGITCSIVELT